MHNIFKRRFIKVLQVLLLLLILVVLFFTCVNIYFNFAYVTTYVRGYSMYPTLNDNASSSNVDGDQIYLKNGKVEVGDIVVANVDWFEDGIIKRLVGCPGDTIQILEEQNGSIVIYNLYVNDKLLMSKEKSTICARDPLKLNASTYHYYNNLYLGFLNNPQNINNVTTNEKGKCIVLNDDEYFLMGDNWGETTDSMVNGPVKSSNIVGKVELIIKPDDNKAHSMFNFIIDKLFK